MCSYWAVPLPLQLTWMGEEAIFHCINPTMREAQKLQRNVSIVCMFTNPQPPQSSGFLNQSKWEFSTQKYIYIWVRKKKSSTKFCLSMGLYKRYFKNWIRKLQTNLHILLSFWSTSIRSRKGFFPFTTLALFLTWNNVLNYLK